MSTIKQWLVDSLTTDCFSSRPIKKLKPLTLNAVQIDGFCGALSCLYMLAAEHYLKRSRPDTEPTITDTVKFIMLECEDISNPLTFRFDMRGFLCWLFEQQKPDDPFCAEQSASWYVEKWNEYQNKKTEVKK